MPTIEERLAAVEAEQQRAANAIVATRNDLTATSEVLRLAKADLEIALRDTVPIGTVAAFACDLTQQLQARGWMVCDGTPLAASDYEELFNTIGTAHGPGFDDEGRQVDGADFNLPDYRGRFLRGVDLTGRVDVDMNQRVNPRTGVNSGAGVGSIQSDELRSHSHWYKPVQQWGGDFGHCGIGVGNGGLYPNEITASFSGGSETRPKNASVQFLIKVK